MYNKYVQNKSLVIPNDIKSQIKILFKKWSQDILKIETLWTLKKIEEATYLLSEIKNQLSKLICIINSNVWNDYLSNILFLLNRFVFTSDIKFIKIVKKNFDKLACYNQ